jgi:deoxyribose-phosphate aldolase
MKTSTGYAEKGASLEAVKLMRKHLADNVLIKASGGIKNFIFAKQLISPNNLLVNTADKN